MDQYSSLLLQWPDVLPKLPPTNSDWEHACWLLRRQQWIAAEALLLRLTGESTGANYETQWLLAYLYCQQGQYLKVESILNRIDDNEFNVEQAFGMPLDYLRLQCIIHHPSSRVRIQDLEGQFLVGYKISESPFDSLAFIDRCFVEGRHDQAERALSEGVGFDCIEVVLRTVFYLNSVGRKQEAFEKLLPCVQRFPQHFPAARYAVALAMELKAASVVLPLMHQVIEAHGERPELLSAVTELKLIQRDPSLARRSSCVTRLWQVTKQRKYGNIPNHLTSFEQNGLVSWFEYIWSSAYNFNGQSLQQIQDQIGNLICQLSSIESKRPQNLCRDFFQILPSVTALKNNHQKNYKGRQRSVKRLKIGWMSGDYNPHPVSRFLLGFLEHSASANSRFSLEHRLLNSHGASTPDLVERFAIIPDVDYLDVSQGSANERCERIREQGCDVLVDLSGWTGGHFQHGLYARLAPLQLNYLGYFASTFNPSMDGWVGDHHLFPDPVLESHTESIHRLGRCFLAWQPSDYFPEASAVIDEAGGASGEIRFGSFNHNRKLSDPTLRLWGVLLEQVPGARLVLKANSSYDTGTSELLQRRMRRQGLDPEKVIWLPLTPTFEEHLKQYQHIDIALDCFPNGGCTTTCEALWMGVPTITLSGRSYVSRMSTAVLNGAAMSDWCAASQQEYLQLAIDQATQVRWLRANRDHWRHRLQQNPLGDAADLMNHLGQLFCDLHGAIM